MLDLVLPNQTIPPMGVVSIDTVRQLEDEILKAPQVETPTSHLFHAGVYARTIMIPAGVILTGALVKIATVLIVSGDVIVYVGCKSQNISGYNVLAASANRKQAFVARTDTYITMIFATDLKTIEEAENYFTDESDRLMSRHQGAMNEMLVIGTEDVG